MAIAEGLGYLALVLVVASSSMRTLTPLRVLSIASNLTLIGYSLVEGLLPLLILHSLLLSINSIRLLQMQKLVRRVKESAHGDLALEGLLPLMTKRNSSAAAAEEVPPVGDSPDWGSAPIQKFVLWSTDNGIYNTPVDIYALHACDEDMDYYLVNAGGDWTATQAGYESANAGDGQIRVDSNGNLTIDWQPNFAHCDGGFDVTPLGGQEHICRYMNYPLFYEVDILPPSGPMMLQLNAAPAGDQGLSASYESGFSFNIGGELEVSGDGPSGGLQAGVSWDNTVSTTVPPLVVNAGDTGNEGTFTRYAYCTVGDTVENCTSTLQMTGSR